MSTSVPAFPLVVQVEQPLITANGRLVLSVEQAGGQPYTGYLDYDQLVLPLHIGFVDKAGNEVSTLTIAPDKSWTLRVLTADNAPYDGFLQVRQLSGALEVWADQRGYPIYVHDGQVEVLPAAFKCAAS